MKRLFHIIFIAYFIVLIFVPCGDKDNCNEIRHEQTAENSGDHQDEVCTPLCVCSCCATHFVVKPSPSIQNQIAVVNTIYTIHPESETSAAIIAIWQPPRLS